MVCRQMNWMTGRCCPRIETMKYWVMQLSLLPKIPNAADLVVNNLILDLRLFMDLYIDSPSIEAGLGMEGARLPLFYVYP